MITEDLRNKKNPSKESAYLPSSIKPRTLEALNKKAKETGNRSFHVNKALEIYLGLEEEPDTQEPEETEKLAS